MKSYERPNRKRRELKKYQKVIISVLLAIVFIATIILLVMFWDSIFSENTWAIIMLVIFVVLVVGGLVVLWGLKRWKMAFIENI